MLPPSCRRTQNKRFGSLKRRFSVNTVMLLLIGRLGEISGALNFLLWTSDFSASEKSQVVFWLYSLTSWTFKRNTRRQISSAPFIITGLSLSTLSLLLSTIDQATSYAVLSVYMVMSARSLSHPIFAQCSVPSRSTVEA